jgi:hypothetical protein
MCIKLLINALKKRFKKSSPDNPRVCELANAEAKSITTEKKTRKAKRSKKIMADEKEVEKVEATEKVEETKTNDVDKEKSTETVENKEEKVEETDKKVDEAKKPDEETEKENPTEPVVENTEPVGNGIRIEDLVTKDMLAERLSAMEAKFDAVVKENNDLKEKLSAKDEELTGMKDKYENKDFGNFQKQGMQIKDKEANSSFDEYSKQFMS